MEKINELEIIAGQLEPDKTERNIIAGKAGQYIEDFLESLRYVKGFQKGNLEKISSIEIDDDAKSLDELLTILRDEVDSTGINTASGRHLGYIPGGGLWTSSIADMLAAASNRYVGVAYSSPGAVKIENQIIHWLNSIVGYPPQAHGNLTSGGSIASLTAIIAARDFHRINSENVKKSVIYFSEQVHHCIFKALHITGLHEAVMRPITLNRYFQMDINTLAEQMNLDLASGRKPFLVIASAGTTDTGAIDPLDKIADICKTFNTWFHVDAAYGGFFILAESAKQKFNGIEHSDSVVLDPHKTLFIPYGSGAVLVRNRETLFSSFAREAAYMKDSYGQDEINPSDTGIELTKHFRGLRMWLPLHLHGLKPFKANLEEKLLLCQYFHREIGKMGFETGPEPQLSIAIFRYPGDDSFNQALVDELHKDGRVFLSSTTINGKLWIRCAVVSHRTHLREIELALQMIRENFENLKGK